MRKGFLRSGLRNVVNKVKDLSPLGRAFVTGILLFAKPVCAQTPTITAVSPVIANNGAAVSISGTNFNATTTNNIVYFGATRATVNSATTTSLNVTVPVGSIFGPLTVNNAATNLVAFSQRHFLPTFSGGPVTIGFASKVDFTTGGTSAPWGIALGDIDGDGKSDIVVVNNGSSNLTVYRNISSSGSITLSSFAAGVTFSLGGSCVGLSIGDIDGDGKLDIAVTKDVASQVALFHNTSTIGSISMAARVDIATNANPTNVYIQDLDADGKSEVVVVNFLSSNISVYRNIGSAGSITVGSFAAKVDFAVNSNPEGIAIGDIDGNGLADVVVSNRGSANVSVFRNLSSPGTITFAGKVDFSTAGNPVGVALADIDGDGALDILTANISNSLTVLRNTSSVGSITMASGVNFSAGSTPFFAVAVADFDADGKPDVALSNFSAANAVVLRNTATSGVINAASFSPFLNFTSGAGSYSVAAGDLDGDGRADIVTANNGPSSISVLRNAPPPNAVPSYTGGNPQYLSVCQNSSANAINSLLQVSDADAGQTLTWTLTVPATNGTVTMGGTATSTGGNVTPAGYSYSPLPGFAGSDAFSIQIADGAGGFASTTIIVTVNPAPTTITGTTTVCRGLTTTLNSTPSGGTWTSGNPAVATVGGGTGIVTGVASGTANITYTLGSCITTTTVTVIGTPVVSSLSSYVAAPGASITISGNDFNTSTTNNIVYFGATRAVVTSASNTSLTVTVPDNGTYAPVSVTNTTCPYTGYSSNSFLPTYNNSGFVANTVNFDVKVDNSSGGSFPNHIYAGDIDGDGKTDVVFVNFSSNSVVAFRNTSTPGSVSFASGTTVFSGGNIGFVTIGEIDGDGKPEIIVPVSGTASVTVLRNTSTPGTFSFASGVAFTTVAGCNSANIADIDMDGRPDIVTANQGTTVSVLRNTGSLGSLSFATHLDFSTGAGSNPTYAFAGDVDGDGKSDILSANTSNGTISVFRNTSTIGSVSFAARIDLTTGTTPVQVGMADLDGDGKLDIVDVNQTSANFSVFPNTSTPGTIATGSRIDFAAGPTAHGISYGDFNGDGKTDVVVSNISSSNASVYRNTSTGTGVFTFGAVNFITGAGPGGVFVVDIDGDGKSDLATDNQSANTFSILRNKPLQPITGTLTVCPGTTTILSNATTGGAWSSSNPAVATVGSGTGIVSGVALGSANITYAGTAGPSFTGNIVVVTVTVMALPSAITGTTSVCTGATTPLSSATSGGTWSTSNAVVATVGSGTGIVSGLTTGVVTISYTVSTGCYVTTPVTVNQTPTGISGTFSVCVGLTTTLSNGYGSGVWTSSNTGVATVGSASGVVTGVSGGNSTITYTLPGNCFVTQQVTVNTNPASITGTDNVCVGGNVTLSNATPSGLFSSSSTGVATIGGGTGMVTGITAGTTNISYTITATGCYSVMPFTVNPNPAAITGTTNVCVGLTTTLSNATSGGTWSSSNLFQASIGSATGVVTGVSAGNPVITYLLSTGCYVTTPFTVNPLPAAITGSATVCVGSNVMLTNTTGTGVWSSSNPAEATIGTSSGIVTGVLAGTPTITYTLPTGCIGTRIQTVNPLPAAITGVLTACPGTTTTLSNTSVGGAWTSNNTSVATIGSGTGIVTGVAAGTSTITYTLPTGCIMTAVVTINPNPAAITGTPTLCTGSTTTFASATGGGTWSSSNTGIATIGAVTGIATGVSNGVWVCTYTMATGCISTVTSTVNPTPSAIGGTPNVCVGLTTTLTNGSGSSTWSSSNASLATVGSGTGIVTGVAAGALNISFTLPTGCFVTMPFTVNPTPAASAGTPNVCVGSTRTLTNSTSGGTWSASNASATVNSTSGVVTGVSAGTLNITYTLPAGCFSVLPFTVNVMPGAIGSSIVSSYTPGAYTYVVPAGVTSVDVTVNGAQGGSNGSGLGGNGGRVQGSLSVSPGQQLFVFVGSQGANYVSTGAAGGNSFGGGEDGGVGGSSNGGAGGGAASDVRTSITGGATSFASLSSRVFVGGGGGGGNFSCSPRLNGGVGGFPAGGNGLASCSVPPTGGSQVAGGNATCYSGNCGTNGGFGNGGGATFWGGGGGGGYYGGAGSGEASGAGGSSYAGAGTSGVSYTNGSQTGNGSVTISYIVAVTSVCVGSNVLLSNATPGGVWSSSNPAIATIGSTTGLVTGISAGSVIFSYTTAGNCSATLAFTVNATPSANTGGNNVCVGSSITLANSAGGGSWSASNANVSVGSSTGVVTGVTAGTVNVTYAMPTGCIAVTAMTVNSTPAAITGASTVCTGQTTTLSSATAGGTWSSSNTALSTVSGTGVVTGVASGTLNITYTTNPGSCFVTWAMTVNQTPPAIVGSSNLCIGVPTPLSNSIGGGVWTSSNSSLASIGSSSGVATGIALGNPVITYTLPGGCFATMLTTVNNQPAAITGSFIVCETLTTTLGNTSSGGLWTSSNSGQASVGSTTGVVTGVSAGIPNITYTLPGGCNSIQQITVNPQPAVVTGTAIVCVNATTTLSSATFGGTWSSSNTSLATVGSSSGIVTGVSAGNPVISYTLPAGCFSIATMTVNALPTVYAVTGGGAYCAGGTGVAIGVSNSNTGINYQLYRGTVAVGSPVSGTGSAISFGLQTVAGTYTVVATNTTTGCFVGMSGTATVTINPLPFTYVVAGGGAYCSGGSGLNIRLMGSAAFGFTYQLYIGGTTPVGLPIAGTGVMLDFGLHSTAGTYTVVATNTATGCTNTMLGSAVISINPLPTAYAVTVTGSGAYCAGGIGQQVGLASSAIGFSYQLFNSGTPVGAPLPGTGSALNFGYQTAAGTYTVVSTNSATSCINSMTGSAVITINPLPTVYSVTLSGGGSYCAGGTGVDVLLSGSEIGVNYLVYLNGVSTGVSLAGTGSALNFGAFTSAGTYTIIATNSVTTCVNTMSGSPVLTINPLPTVFSVTGGGSYCSGGTGVSVGLSNSSIGVSYQLYDAGAVAIGGPIAGTGVALDFGLLTPASTYTVVATNATTGCVSNMSGSATVTIDPLPNVYPVLGGGAYCVGGTGVNVELLTSDLGFDYQLYNGITPIGAPLTGTGSLLSFGAQTAAGTYTIHSTDMVTGCVSVMSGSAAVTIDPLPVAYTVTGGGNYCSGGAGVLVGLSSSQAGVDYELYIDGIPTGTIVPGTGIAISFGMQTTAGIYTVEADNPTTTCTNNMTGSATVAINPLPVVYFVTGGGNYCVGGAGVHVGLSGSNIGFSYQLYDATAVAVGGPLAGTGAALDYGMLAAVGTYTVVATDLTTGCVNDMAGSATVGTDALPVIYNVTGGGAYCAGGTGMNIDLDNSEAGASYQLYKDGVPVGAIVSGTGFPISFGPQTAAGAYTVVATGGTGCTENMAGFAAITINPLPVIYAVTGGGSYCLGGTGVHIGLGGSTAGIEYQLFDGSPVGAPITGTGLPIDFGLVTGAGVYSVLASNPATGCTSTMTGTANVSIDAPPGLYIVTGGGNYCAGGTGTNIYLLGSAPGVNYQLFIGSSPIGSLMPGTGGTLDFGPQTLAGVYTVQGTDVVTGCTSLMALSATVSIDPLPTMYTVTGGGSLCPDGAGVTVGLSNSDVGITYQLLRDGVPEVAPVSGIGAAFDFGIFTGTGTYTVLAVSGAGCLNNMTGSTTVAHYPLPTLYTVTGGGTYCAGGAGVPVSLNGSQAGVDYQLWMGTTTVGPVVAGTGSPISFGMQTAIGNYTVMAINPVTTCTDTMYGSANVITNPLPIAQTLTGGGSYCAGGAGAGVSMTSSETGVLYQLYNGTTPVGSPLAGTGFGLDFGLHTTTGTYTITATNVTTLCTSNMAGSVTISISPLPTAYTVTGGGNYCSGGAGVNIGLSNSQSGVNYQLFMGSAPVSSLVGGTGGLITFGLQTSPGIYTVVATNASTLCTKNMTGSVTVGINVLPTAYTVTGGGSYCTGGSGVSIGLSGSATGVKYQLFIGTTAVGLPVNGTGASISFGMHTAPGVYKVVATNSTTLCSNDMAGTVSVAINPLPTAYTVTGSGSSYCAGGTGVSVYISGSQTGVNYQLLRGTAPVGTAVAGSGTPLDFGPQTVAGTYTVVANNTATGCMSNMTGLVSVSIDPLPNVYSVTGGGNYCPGGTGVHVGLSSSNTGIKYQLYNGGPVGPMVTGTGAAIDFGVLTTTGTYTVIASNSITGCTSNMTGSATIGLNPLPVAFTVTGGGGYCSGGVGVSVGLNGSITGTNYQLYYGSTALGGAVAGTGLALNFGLQTTAGSYTVRATDVSTSCTSNMTGAANVAINVLPTAYVVTGGGNYCAGGAGMHIGLSNSDAGISYQLYNGTATAGAPVTGTGTSIDFGVFTATGSYTVVAKNLSTLCTSNMTGSVGIGINPLPTAFSVVGGGAYCSGTGGIHVGLSSSSAGVSYELRKDGSSVLTMTGTGLPIDFGLQTATGIYTVVAMNSTTMCSNSMSGSTAVTVNPTVVPSVSIVSATGDTTCAGNIGNFSAAVVNGGSAPLYQWAVNGVNVGTGSAYSYVPADGDIVSVSLTSSAVCAMPATVNASMAITVLPMVTPSVSVSAIPGAIVCAGTVVNYTASYANGGLSPVFEWKKNGVVVGSSAAYSTIPANGDEITCIMTSSNRCVSHRTVSSSFNMIVNDPVTPIVNILASPGLNISAGLPLTLTADITNAVTLPSYQWSVNGVPVTGATMPQFTSDNFANLDIVTCTVTSGGGCAGSAGTGTVTIRVVGVGVNNIASIGNDIQLIPNPNKGTFNVRGTLSTNTNEEVSMEVTNMLGQSILVRKVDVRNGEINESVQLSGDIANGMYILTLRSESGSKVFHIVVER